MARHPRSLKSGENLEVAPDTNQGLLKMYRKISLVLVSASLAVIVVFLPACKEDDNSAADDGKAAAKAYCNCFKAYEAAVIDIYERQQSIEMVEANEALKKCVEDVEKKYAKYAEIKDKKHPYAVAFESELKKCDLKLIVIDDLW